MAIDARHLRRGDVVGGLHELGEVTHHEASMAVGTIRTAQGGRCRMVGVLSQRRPIHHHHAIPLHTRFMTGLAVARDADVVHCGAGKGHEIRRRMADFTGLRGRHVGARLARGMDVVMAADAVVRDTSMIVVRCAPRQRHEMAGAALGGRWNVIDTLANGLHSVMTGTAGT